MGEASFLYIVVQFLTVWLFVLLVCIKTKKAPTGWLVLKERYMKKSLICILQLSGRRTPQT
jgi:hypothetical protein